MPDKARRLLLRAWQHCARRALLIACLWPTWAGAQDIIVGAYYADPTTRYAHAVLGDAVEYETLVVTMRGGAELRFVLPPTSVFEDTAPRLADVTGDGRPEVIVVESDQSAGARLVVYSTEGRLAATPYIGTRFRWLAPIGAADLDRDGLIELAYIDRPHLAKTLRIWRYQNGALVPVADLAGFTNHRIGETDIAGGIRECGSGLEMIAATADWAELVAIKLENNEISVRSIMRDTTREAFARAMSCNG